MPDYRLSVVLLITCSHFYWHAFILQYCHMRSKFLNAAKLENKKPSLNIFREIYNLHKPLFMGSIVTIFQMCRANQQAWIYEYM